MLISLTQSCEVGRNVLFVRWTDYASDSLVTALGVTLVKDGISCPMSRSLSDVLALGLGS